LSQLGSDAADGRPSRRIEGVDEELWEVDTGDSFAYVAANRTTPFVLVLECGKARCKDADEGVAMAKRAVAHIPAAAKDRRRMRQFLGDADIGTWESVPRFSPEKYEWDRITLHGSVRGGAFAVGLRVFLKPEKGLPAKTAAWAKQLDDAKPDVKTMGAGAVMAESAQGFEFVFSVPETEVVIRFHCAHGLCPDEQTARSLAERVRDKARDSGNFIDTEARRPQPFVPRGNVKGRAERIWLPSDRFWLEIE
jgi:hypothetical protein